MEPRLKMLKSNRLQQVFAEAKRPAMGFWQMLPGANVSRILARSGADWILVDCEHGNMDGEEPAYCGYFTPEPYAATPIPLASEVF